MSDIIQSVDRALEVMIYLYHEGKETSITKIAADLGVYKSTVYRTLVTLENRGFVRKNPETDKYWLGNRLFVLGKGVENRMGLPEIVRPYAKKLYDAYCEVVNVSILERNPDDVYRSVIILKEESDRQVLTVNPPVGSSSECYCSSVGKCLLAYSSDIDLGVYDTHPMRPHTEHTIITVSALRAELAKVRERGYAMDHEELEYGLTCIGAPILDQKGEAVAAISLSGPTSRMLTGDIEERIEAVKRIAREISSNF
ncbi:IclR family transcriptional regulator domain-containing protein [Intestinimonas butyriciproducens]|uniref:Glycerol operon regulatory protein n=1 Tax=Candidatus Intestinimonas merdavium TaxID=2838622 RepID=A0A9D2CFK9_9FIRM|nr:IclR family transcriptional regulator [Intestinimonas butyriciproducens]HIY74385.1 IclR family transcriptional regulator [Candidatus Intestinimonas merdavium]